MIHAKYLDLLKENMNSSPFGSLKSTRSGIALVGIATMLSLSSCSLFPSGDKESPEPAPSVSSSTEAGTDESGNSAPRSESTEEAKNTEEVPAEGTHPSEPESGEQSHPFEGEAPSGDIAFGVEEPGHEDIYIAPDEPVSNNGEPEKIPEVALETSNGEPIQDAENRYLIGMKKNNDPGYSDHKLLDIGYETCGYYSHSANKTEFYDNLTKASNGDKDAEAMYVYASGAASITLCPEYEKKFS